MPDLEPEARRRVDIHAVRPLLVALILPDEPQVLALDDDRVLHPSRHDDAFQGLAADGQSTVERAFRVRARLLRYRNVNPDVPHGRADRSRRGGRRGRFLLRLLPRHLDSPGLLHAILGSKSNLIAVDLEAAGDVEPEAAAVFRDSLLLSLHVDHQHVASLVDDASADMLLARVGCINDLHPQPDQFVLPQVHHHVSSPDGVAFAGAAFAGAGALPANSSSRMIVRIRAMFFRSARIFPGFGGAPPIAATPRSCMSSSRSSVSLFAIVSASIARISFVMSIVHTFYHLIRSPRRRRPRVHSPASRLS